jgi:transposase
MATLSGAGLWRLLRQLEETSADGVALEIIRRWADRSTKLRREAKGLERRYLGYRDWFYHNVTVQLCRRYQRLVIETTGLQAEAGKTGQETAMYSHLAALSCFLRFLRNAAAKTGTEIVVVATEAAPISLQSNLDAHVE